MNRARVVFVGHSSYALPLPQDTGKKWHAVAQKFDFRVVGESRGHGSDARFLLLAPSRVPALRGVAFYCRLPAVLAKLSRSFQTDAIVAQSPYEGLAALLGRRLLRRKPAVIVEVHGDWRTAARLYGSPARKMMAPLADKLAVAALRRADAVRVVGPAMATLVSETTGRKANAVFPTFFDADTYFESPPVELPSVPTALWVGTLQHYKNPDMLIKAWPSVVTRIPNASLVIVGDGPLRGRFDELARRFPTGVRIVRNIPPDRLVREFDAATALVLPSRSEGLPRVAMEALARGRPVIGAYAGGIPDVVQHGRNGLLVSSGDAIALAEALTTLLGNQDLAARLGAVARQDAEKFYWPPAQYAEALASLVMATLASHGTETDPIVPASTAR